MPGYDVIVIGAGPAGAATALFLHARGYRVCVLERARFPRDKVCGEFISPAADNILEELGVLTAIEAEHPLRLRGVAVSAYEGPEVVIDYPPHAGRIMSSLSVPRLRFDHLLCDRMKQEGIEVRERHQVDDLVFDSGAVTGVTGRDPENRVFTVNARAVVDAGGRNAISLRRMGLRVKPEALHGKVALAAHWEHAVLPGDYCYMHISRPGYTGIAPMGNHAANVVLVVPVEEVRGQDLQAFYERVVLQNKKRRALLEGAVLSERVRSVDSLAFEVKPVPCGGLLLAGDAMGFIDPFTGEGIYLGLRSAQLAAEVLDEALRAGDVSRRMLGRYEQRRQQEFHRKFVLSRILQNLIYRPPLCRSVVRLLAAHPAMAETLAGVVGDYLPAKRVVSWAFLARLLAAALRPGWLAPARVPRTESPIRRTPLQEEL